MTQQLFDSTGTPVRLGSEMKSGGEGIVYEIQGDPKRVAKIWKLEKRNTERTAKLQAMRRISANSTTINYISVLAWPDEILYEGRELVGYRMPKAENASNLFDFMTTQRRKQIGVNMNTKELALLAQNIALIFNILHQHQCYIGDVNDQNILVRHDNLIPIIIDSDSFQIQNPANANRPFLSQVRVSEYQPPERKDMSQPIGPSTDAFGLAVIIYKLLVGGAHPFQGRDSINEVNQIPGIEERIQANRFAHAPRRQRTWIPIENAQIRWIRLPDEIRKVLAQALDYQRHGTNRPSAQEMADALENLAEPARSAQPRQANQQPQTAHPRQANQQPQTAHPRQANQQPQAAQTRQTNQQPQTAQTRQPNQQPRAQQLAQQGAKGWLKLLARGLMKILLAIGHWEITTLKELPIHIRLWTVLAGILTGLALNISLDWSPLAITIGWGLACRFLGQWPRDGWQHMVKAFFAGAVIAGVAFLIIALINLFFP